MSPRAQTALTNIAFARNYTLWVLDALPVADWFRMPPGGVTHVGWQVGHLAVAEYRLALFQIRGPRPDDSALIPDSFLTTFGRDSVVDPDPAKYPPADEIRRVFDRVHARVLEEVPTYSDADLDGPLTREHRLCKTRIESLHWCSHHEAVHAGQISLVCRQLGRKPLW